MKNIVKRSIMFLFSLFTIGLGISLVTKSNLGTSAISSIPYVLSLIYPFSFGTFTFITNIVFVLLQVIILRDKFAKRQYIQLIVGPFLGLFIDLGMFIFAFVDFDNYLGQLVTLIIGCFIIAFGIFLQLTADVITNPGEGIVKAIATRWNKEFSTVKVYSDFALVIIAVTLSMLAFGTVQGIREGTLLTIIIVGPMIKIFEHIFNSIGFEV